MGATGRDAYGLMAAISPIVVRGSIIRAPFGGAATAPWTSSPLPGTAARPQPTCQQLRSGRPHTRTVCYRREGGARGDPGRLLPGHRVPPQVRGGDAGGAAAGGGRQAAAPASAPRPRIPGGPAGGLGGTRVHLLRAAPVFPRRTGPPARDPRASQHRRRHPRPAPQASRSTVERAIAPHRKSRADRRRCPPGLVLRTVRPSWRPRQAPWVLWDMAAPEADAEGGECLPAPRRLVSFSG
jgi:hypothetical protein